MQGIAGGFQNFLSSFSYKAFAVFGQNLYKNCKGSTTPQGRSIPLPPLDALFITLWNWHSSFSETLLHGWFFLLKTFTCTVHSRIINMTQLETMNKCTIPCVVWLLGLFISHVRNPGLSIFIPRLVCYDLNKSPGLARPSSAFAECLYWSQKTV